MADDAVVNNPIPRLREDPSSKARAIKAMCAQCMGCTDDYTEPGFRQQVRTCTSKDCALWAVRPYQVVRRKADVVVVTE